MVRRGRWSWLAVAALVSLAAACGTRDDVTSATGLTLPLPSGPDTLLPVPNDTQPPDVTDTLPPDALFGGDVCTALTDADLPGTLVDSGALSEDSCQYVVRVGGREMEIVVQLQSPADFLNPGVGDEEVDELSGIGLAARGVTHVLGAGVSTSDATTDSTVGVVVTEYEVIVKVPNGFFSVTAPDRATAERLARAAEPRAVP